MRLTILPFITWIYLSYPSLPRVSGADGECDVNVCDDDDPGFICASGSFIVIQEVMCRTRGRNCDIAAYQEVTRLCAGLQHCNGLNLWLVSGKYCERNEKKQFLSIVFVSYVCVEEMAVESDCSQWGTRVSTSQRYLSSPGYPALVTGNSVCTWRLHPPQGMHADIFIREYLHLDITGQQNLDIRKMSANGDVLSLDRTAKRDLTTTIDGDVEISLHTDESNKGHRMFIEYRYVTPPLEHLRPFPVLNKTECGATVLDTIHSSGGPGDTNIIRPSPAIPASPTSPKVPLQPLLPTANTKLPKDILPTIRPTVNGTDLRSDKGSNTALTVSIAVCAVGLCCCVVAIFVTCRHRRKKSTANKRNCFESDAYGMEYNQASTISAHSNHPYSRPLPTSPRHHPRPADRVDFVRQSEIVHLKSGYRTPEGTIIEVSPIEEVYAGEERLDKNGKPLDLSKYLITDSDNTTNTITSKTSSRSSNGHIYDVVREH